MPHDRCECHDCTQARAASRCVFQWVRWAPASTAPILESELTTLRRDEELREARENVRRLVSLRDELDDQLKESQEAWSKLYDECLGLRRLITQAQWAGRSMVDGTRSCPWCGYSGNERHAQNLHAPDCPAAQLMSWKRVE